MSVNGCMAKTCADYTSTNGLTGGAAVTTHTDCSTLDSTCTIGNYTC